MRKSQLISQIIRSANPAFEYSQAMRLFVHQFVDHFFDKDFHEWDSELAPHIATTFLLTIDTDKRLDVKYLVEELDRICKESKS